VVRAPAMVRAPAVVHATTTMVRAPAVVRAPARATPSTSLTALAGLPPLAVAPRRPSIQSDHTEGEQGHAHAASFCAGNRRRVLRTWLRLWRRPWGEFPGRGRSLAYQRGTKSGATTHTSPGHYTIALENVCGPGPSRRPRSRRRNMPAWRRKLTRTSSRQI
jgi:hypothetical protein